ncbi:diguanylate cyclase [Thalassomonas sp. RHCl1]|uniref:transporter substrate-binding domain-containing diguanylate cyclase n=1 Tax=Thalassomonas sp. RHCl1 TaxID=2995320 RepID=UPI00248B4050|nr:diguanylate cyclase [Thalassomonas sp. RHCl1]
MLFVPLLVIIFLLAAPVSANVVNLTADEQAWLQQHPKIRIAGDPDYAPFEFRNSRGELMGISQDILGYCLDVLAIELVEVPTHSWKQAQDHLNAGTADLLTVASQTTQRDKYLTFSQPYLYLPVVILTRNDINRQLSLKDLYGLTLITVYGFGVNEYLEQFSDKINLVYARSTAEALQKLSFGSADAMLLNLGTASYQIQALKLTNLRVSGEIDYTYQLAFAVRSELSPLIPILDKVLAAMPPGQKQQFISKWISLEQDMWRPSKYQTLMTIAIITALGFALMCALYLSLNHTLTAQNKALEQKSLLLEKEIEERKLLEIQLKEQVFQDDLTGLANRRKLLERVALEWPRSLRASRPISILMLDLDHFKIINDSFGHDIGDKVLKSIANILQDSTRITDLVARWGGEEFVLMLPETGHDLAMEIAERIREKVAATELAFQDNKVNFTISIGVATTENGEPSFTELLSISDMALYQSKEQGRNRVSSIII